MNPITPGTWPQVVSVAVFLLLFALPTLAINPTLRKNPAKLVAYGTITAALAIPTALTALDMNAYAGWAALGLVLYTLFVGFGFVLSVGARYRHHGIKRRAKDNDEIIARFERDMQNGATP